MSTRMVLEKLRRVCVSDSAFLWTRLVFYYRDFYVRPGYLPDELLHRFLRPHHYIELYAHLRARPGGGKRADYLAHHLQPVVQRGQVTVEARHVEPGGNQIYRVLRLHVLAEAVLLVFGQDLHYRGVYLYLVDYVFCVPAAAPGERVLYHRGYVGIVRAFDAAAAYFLGEDFQPVQCGKYYGSDFVGNFDLAQPEGVKQRFELVGELGDSLEAEHAGEAFQGMDAAEDGVHDVRVYPAGLGHAVHAGQMLAQVFEDILRLGQELSPGPLVFPCHSALSRTPCGGFIQGLCVRVPAARFL